mmetsp:Transcript_5741/g.17063  ORF Transcript_5741/g.17063 Transcript_5741/m.17063 type:complete len:222 (+) Transcript_5741:878-1543(+)
MLTAWNRLPMMGVQRQPSQVCRPWTNLSGAFASSEGAAAGASFRAGDGDVFGGESAAGVDLDAEAAATEVAAAATLPAALEAARDSPLAVLDASLVALSAILVVVVAVLLVASLVGWIKAFSRLTTVSASTPTKNSSTSWTWASNSFGGEVVAFAAAFPLAFAFTAIAAVMVAKPILFFGRTSAVARRMRWSENCSIASTSSLVEVTVTSSLSTSLYVRAT